MTYMENIFICMASPLLIAALCMGKRHTGAFLFCLAGMGMCLLSAYLNTFLAALYGAGCLCRHCGDCACGGGRDEAAAAALLSFGI